MPIDFNVIKTNEDFIDYFIYFYEYTFTLTEMDDFDIKSILKDIVSKNKYENYKDLWIYAYLYISKMMLGDLPLEFLKDTIQRLMKDFKCESPLILEMQLELLRDTFHTLGFVVLEPRPYEQLFKNGTYGAFMLDKKNELLDFFEKNQNLFSDSGLNQMCYVKFKNNRYMDKKLLIFEYYSVVLFNIIKDIRDEDEEEKDEIIEDEIKSFIKSFKKGKFNNEFSEQLIKITHDLSEEYIRLGFDDNLLVQYNGE